MTQDEARSLLLQLLPPGIERAFDFTPGPDPQDPASGASDPWLIVDAAAEGMRLALSDNIDQASLDADPVQLGALGASSWEDVLALAQTQVTLYGTQAERLQQILGRLRVWGLPTDANTQAILAAYFGLASTDVEIVTTARADLTAAHTYPPEVDTGYTVAAGDNAIRYDVADDAKVSKGGVEWLFTLTHASVEDLSVTISDPAYATTVSFPAGCLGSGSVTSQAFILRSPGHAGLAVGGAWVVTVHNAGANVGAIDSGSGLFVEGIGRDTTGNDGLGAGIFEWSARLPSSSATYALSVLPEALLLVERIQPAGTRGGLALRMTDGGSSALLGDANCIAGLCILD